MLLIGTKLAIKGDWDTSPDPAGRVVVTLIPSPHTKVGNPYAPWTRSMLEAIEALVQPGMAVVDLGAGIGILALASVASGAGAKAELTGAHLCCGPCFKAMQGALDSVAGVSGKIDRGAKSVSISAADAATVQKGVDAVAAAGFYGKLQGAKAKFKDDSGAPAGQVTSLVVSGAHNCCGKCCGALIRSVKKVKGVTGHTIKPRVSSFKVNGNFSAAALVKALNGAGFHVTVK